MLVVSTFCFFELLLLVVLTAGQLWTAPELLRMHSRPLEGTLKGDVYSFAIICQEIVYRNGVFHLLDLDLTPEGESFIQSRYRVLVSVRLSKSAFDGQVSRVR